jgi:chitosanase
VPEVRPRRRSGLLMAAGLTATALCAAGTVTILSGSASATEPEPDQTAVSTSAAAGGGLTGAQRHRADQMISAFENSTTEIQYGYAENIHDRRGVTSGRAGFCTGTGDAVVVVERYTESNPGNGLARFLPELRRLAASGSDDTGGLPEDAYLDAWGREAENKAFRDVQDQVVDEMYFNPAMAHADEAGLTTALARAEVYDAVIQHGDGDDHDSLGGLLQRTESRAGGTPATGVDEKRWLDAFFAVRIDDLTNPEDPDTRDEWRGSVGRVEALRKLAAEGNYDLRGPIRFSVYGDDFTID